MVDKKPNGNQSEERPASEVLLKVKEAEARARQKIEEARQKTSAELIRQATEEASKLAEKILAEARSQTVRIKNRSTPAGRKRGQGDKRKNRRREKESYWKQPRPILARR